MTLPAAATNVPASEAVIQPVNEAAVLMICGSQPDHCLIVSGVSDRRRR